MRTHYTDVEFNIQTGEVMRVDWCDNGNHAFKAGEPGSQQFTGTVIGEDGTPIQQAMSACAQHSFSSKASAETVPQALDPRSS